MDLTWRKKVLSFENHITLENYVRRRPCFRVCLILLTVNLSMISSARGAPRQRFFIVGDGVIKIKSTKRPATFVGRYRTPKGTYILKALRQINRVLGARYNHPENRVSIRLIEALAYVQKELKGNWIIVSSGFRSPKYNQMLRDKGRTVAKASLHQFGMAVDLRLTGVDSKALWMFGRKHHIGGVGYYGDPWVHLDVGPPRFWTQGTAHVRTNEPEYNKHIILVPEFDIYHPGEILRARFARMTAYPIGIKRIFILERKEGEEWKRIRKIKPIFAIQAKPQCTEFSSIAELTRVRWRIPKNLVEKGEHQEPTVKKILKSDQADKTTSPTQYRIKVSFCGPKWEAMPKEIASYPFQIVPRD